MRDRKVGERNKKNERISEKGKRSYWNLAGIAALIAAIGGIIVPITVEIIKNSTTTSPPIPALTGTNFPTSEQTSTITSDLLTPSNVSAILLSEDFEDDEVLGLVMKRDSWKIIEDPYSSTGNKILEAEKWDFIQFSNSEKWKRYTLDYRINFLSNEISEILAFDDDKLPMEDGVCIAGESTHTILFNPDFIGLYNLTCPSEVDGHEWEELDFATPNIELREWHQIHLEVDEPKIRVWFDGVLRIDYDLSQMNLHLDNRILRLYNKYEIQIDDIKVTEIK